MRLVRLLFLSIFFLFLLITGISLFIPSHVRISRATNFMGENDLIWQKVDDMRSWSAWNPFFSNLTNATVVYIDSTGAKASGMKVNNTSIAFTSVTPAERIVKMHTDNKTFMNGWKCISHGTSDSTTLQWYMDFDLRWYPWEKFASLLFDQSYGGRMEEGLGNLKKIVHDNHSSH
ncbi:MAG: hypothetical protein EOO01_02335 [Chitinophagaceae bacterium]|nr:MAG: hypothetical protein EOO01_02335 [Chitinophagaceae bacterium]